LKEESQQKRDSEMKDLLAKVAKVETTAGTIVDNSDELMAAVNNLKRKLQDESDAEEVEGKVSSLKLTFCELQEQIMDLKKMNHQMVRECVSSVTEIRKEVKQLDEQIKQLQEKLATDQKSLRTCDSSEADAIDKMKDKIRKLESLHQSVTKHSGTGEKSAKFKADIESVSSNLQSMKDQKAALESEKAAIQQEVAESEVVLRSFSDNRRLLNLKAEIAVVNEQLVNLEKKLPVTDVSALERKRRDLNRKAEVIREDVGRVKGRMTAAQQELQRLESELNLAKYQNSDRDFRKAVVDLVTQERVVDDLNKYYKVLDHAVSKYHVRRMQQINQLIGHYWRTTYQGTDIQTIRIVCDEGEERSADKRRSFNYRVVMQKKDAEMDMRGRCSAGQKVLASLVIRIALAQVFCVNCSILTLDEPTTNLDKANVEALARAICGIVEDQKGKIQIVIITHDPEFLKYLNEEFSEFYYEVCKNENGFSSISKKFLRERE
jgi:DNA repair protein RAD50